MKSISDNSSVDELIRLAVDFMGAAVTIVDPDGKMLYYNEQAVKILDRKPEYIGENVRSHHSKSSSNERFDMMLRAFGEGRIEPFHYEANPYGKVIQVVLSPIIKEGTLIGCVQTVRLKEG